MPRFMEGSYPEGGGDGRPVGSGARLRRTDSVLRGLRGIAGIDADPVWSRDGKFIAFHRRTFSTAGPPGLYVVPSSGGAIRFVARGDLWWPEDLRFSPDSKQIVGTFGLQLYTV